ncbi:MAG: MFS transporter, partial [Acidimicrobiales bacterium]
MRTSSWRVGAPRTPDWVVLALACIGQFMVVLDVSIVNVALPSIGRELHYSATGLQWVVNAYVLTFAGFLLLGGRAADLFGRRRVYLVGMALFSLASLVGGFAHGAAWLTTARAAQGIGGAVLSPATLTLIVTTYRGPRLARALGAWSAMAAAGGATGALLGGILTAELSWRWVLFVNVPIGAVTMLLAVWRLSESQLPEHRRALDLAGAVTVTGGLALLAYAIVGTDVSPWGSARTLGLLAGAAVLLGTFLLVEVRMAADPLMPLHLFRSRTLSGANAVMLLVGAAFFSMWYFLSLYLQNVLGYSALRAGIAFVPMTVMIIVGAQVSSRLVGRLGARPLLVAGAVLGAGGFWWLAGIGPTSHYWPAIAIPGCLITLALGLLFTPLATAATSGVDRNEAGLASGVLNTSRQVGGSIGLAALATVATDRTHSVLLAAGHAAAASAVETHRALSAGYGRAFELASALMAVALLVAFVVPALRRGAVTQEAGGGVTAATGRPAAVA